MREKIEKYIELIIGSILLSLGIYLFVTPNGINFGGALNKCSIRAGKFHDIEWRESIARSATDGATYAGN